MARNPRIVLWLGGVVKPPNSSPWIHHCVYYVKMSLSLKIA